MSSTNSNSNGNGDNNPGTMLASAIDNEVNQFRIIQEELNQLHNDNQILLGQMTENEMVRDELELCKTKKDNDDVDNIIIYKKIGPILIQQNYNDAYETINKRLEFVLSENNKLKLKIQNKEETLQSLTKRIQSMQSQLQETTVRAVQSIKSQHNQ